MQKLRNEKANAEADVEALSQKLAQLELAEKVRERSASRLTRKRYIQALNQLYN